MPAAMSRAVFEKKVKEHDAVTKLANAAVINEQVTRHRVEALEELMRRGFLGRMTWLVLGR